MRRLFACSSLALLALSSCVMEAREDDDFHGREPEPIGEISLAATVAQAASAGNCSTAVVFGLSEQINTVVNCLKPGILVPIPARPNFKKSASTFAYMEKPAVDGLVAALDERTDLTLNANSVLRNIASQYLLRSWFDAGLCGITAAAAPGQSNHETGKALDTSDHAAWLTTLEKHGFKWLGSGDVVHFDYVGPGTVDLRPTGIEAFQRLWNHNNPADKIAEDGLYGPMTEARLKQSPTDGFPSVPACGAGGGGGAGGTSSGGSAGAPSGGKAGASSGGTSSGGTSSGGTSSGGTSSGGTSSGGQTGAAGQGAAGEPAQGGAAQGGAGQPASVAGAGGASGGAGGASGASGELVISRDDGGASGGCGCEVPRGDSRGAALSIVAVLAGLVARARRRR